MGNCFGFHPAPDPNNRTSKSNYSSTSRPSTPGKSRGYSNGEGTSSSSTNAATHSLSWASVSDDSCFTGEILDTPKLRTYSFDELRIAAKNFRVDMMLGVGGFGTVYKGWVDGKTLAPSRSTGTSILVAIKKLNSESTQGLKEWQSEINFLGRLWHPNLVRLLGYCWEDKELLLVYEFMQKGSLENHLFRRNADSLSWDLRLKIAIGAARGLAFLHAADQKVIYRDFKASNILLDGSYNAKISDFGLAKLGPSGGDSHVTTRVMGTHGYAAPEYVATGHLYVESDVYGFGVVLLEMLTGLRAVDLRRPSYQQNLVEWAKPCLSQKRKLKTIMDPHIEGQYSSKAAHQAAQLTLKCLDEEHKKRPAMKEVVLTLEHIAALEEPKSMSLSQPQPVQSLRSPRHLRS